MAMSDDLSEHAHKTMTVHTPDGYSHSFRIGPGEKPPVFDRNTFYGPSVSRQEWEAFKRMLMDVLREFDQRIKDMENVVTQPSGSVRFLNLEELRESVGEDINGSGD